jgi:hypothetical protein
MEVFHQNFTKIKTINIILFDGVCQFSRLFLQSRFVNPYYMVTILDYKIINVLSKIINLILMNLLLVKYRA